MKRHTAKQRGRQFRRAIVEQLEPRALLADGLTLTYPVLDSDQLVSTNNAAQIAAVPATTTSFGDPGIA